MPKIFNLPQLKNKIVFCKDKTGVFFGNIILCNCCNTEFSPSKWERHTGSTRHRPWQSICLQDTGKNLLYYKDLYDPPKRPLNASPSNHSPSYSPSSSQTSIKHHPSNASSRANGLDAFFSGRDLDSSPKPYSSSSSSPTHFSHPLTSFHSAFTPATHYNSGNYPYHVAPSSSSPTPSPASASSSAPTYGGMMFFPPLSQVNEFLHHNKKSKFEESPSSSPRFSSAEESDSEEQSCAQILLSLREPSPLFVNQH